jgi:nitronate monooxygenase
MGTRFTATRESLWTDAHKTGVLEGQGDRTVQSRLFDTLNDPDWPRRFPARYLRNKTHELWEGREAELEAVATTERQRYQATPPADFSERLLLAGEGVDLIRDLPSARDLVERTVAAAAAVLRAGAASVSG